MITQGTSHGQIVRQSLRTFHCLSDFGLHKPKKMRLKVGPWACLEKQWVWRGVEEGVEEQSLNILQLPHIPGPICGLSTHLF